MEIKSAIKAAVKNIAKHGDTDIFPFPFECHLFHDKPAECENILMDINKGFDRHFSNFPPGVIEALSQVGYTGFRWASQIEPFWNAYYLACVISIADEIEKNRIPINNHTVYSYRYEWQESTGKLFKDLTWRDFRTKCLENSNSFKYVLQTDVADFYPRIYHHRIDNAIDRLKNTNGIKPHLMRMLNAFSMINVSYGLPIGGPASRILAELALSDVDKHLRSKHITFCRYADDFCIFCDNKSEAYKHLIFLSEQLFNDGLILSKKKTKILSSDEFKQLSAAFMPNDNKDETDEKKLLNISIRFDPYSPTAEEDYENLKEAVKDVDIIGILGREVAKGAIDPTISKQAINAIKALPPKLQGGAIRTILNLDSLDVLSPVFVTILRLLRTTYNSLNVSDKNFVDRILLQLFNDNSSLLSIDLNLCYFIQVLALRKSQEKEDLLVNLFSTHTKPLIKRLILLG
jgi:hypothetical protein